MTRCPAPPTRAARLALGFATLGLAGCWEVDVAATERIGPAEVDAALAWYPLDDPALPGRDRSNRQRPALAVDFEVATDPVRGNVAHFNGGALLMQPGLVRDFTLALWIKTEQMGPDTLSWTDGPRIIDADVSGAGRRDFGIGLAFDKLSVGFGDPDNNTDAAALRSTRPVADGVWHHLSVTRDGVSGRCQVFIDGTLEFAADRAAGLLQLPPTISVGDLGNTSPKSPPLEASISDVRFYGRVLGNEAIAFLASR